VIKDIKEEWERERETWRREVESLERVQQAYQTEKANREKALLDLRDDVKKLRTMRPFEAMDNVAEKYDELLQCLKSS